MTRKNRRTRATTRKAGRARKPVARLTKPVKRAVNQLINRKLETKYTAQYMTGAEGAPVDIYGDVWPQGTGGGPNGNPQLWVVMPDVNEGTQTTEYTREGVKISPTSLVADLDLKFNVKAALASGNIDQASWDITAHIWYGYARRFKNNDDVNANKVNIVENMLEVGDGTTTRWLGTPIMDQFHINREFVSLKHKKVRMYRPLGSQNTATLAGGVTTYYPQVINKTFKLAFKPPKTLMFNELQDSPENFAPFVIIGYRHNDGSQASNTYVVTPPFANIAQVPALQAVIRSHLYFKDA